MSTIVFGQTPPPPKQCVMCKQNRFAWNGTTREYVCLNCTIQNPMAIKYGVGPEGATCGKCEHRIGVGGHARYYPKCELRTDLTNGAKTDQKARWIACAKFEPAQEGK